MIFFDLETTGTSVTADRIVQIAAVKIDDNYNIIPGTQKKLLINPGIAIPAGATKVHGITDEMVKDLPVFKAYAASMFTYFSNPVLAGYNIRSYDVPLLAEEFARCGIVWPAPDVKIIDQYKIFSLKEKRDLSAALKFYTGEEMTGAHDAENDNLATVKIFKGQMDMYGDLNEMCYEELHEFCCEGKKTLDIAGKIGINENGEAYYTFGKAANILVKNDTGFGHWMLKSDFTTDTKNVLRKLLKL